MGHVRLLNYTQMFWILNKANRKNGQELGGDTDISIKFGHHVVLRVISGFRVCFFNNCIEKNQNKTHFEGGTSKFPAPLPLEQEERTADVSDSDIVELQSLMSAQENQRRNILKEFLNKSFLANLQYFCLFVFI